MRRVLLALFLALAVAFTLNGHASAQSQNVVTGSLGALNAAVTLTPQLRSSTCTYVLSGTWSGTVTLEGSADGFVNSNKSLDTETANGTYVIGCAGYTQFQVVMTAYTSGTANVTLTSSTAGAGGTTTFPSSLPIVVTSALPVSLATCPAAPNAPCAQITGPVTVNTSAPYVAPTCPAAPNAPCVQVTGTVPISGAPTPYPTNADGGAPAHIVNSIPAGTNAIGGITLANNPCTSGTVSNYAVNISTAVTTQAVAISGSTKIYICKVLILSAGATNVTLEYGTGSLCATGLTTFTGAMPLAAQVGWMEPIGLAPDYVTPAGQAFCIVNSAAIQISGSIEYVQQ